MPFMIYLLKLQLHVLFSVIKSVISDFFINNICLGKLFSYYIFILFFLILLMSPNAHLCNTLHLTTQDSETITVSI